MKQTRQLEIDGMTCQMCVRHVAKALGTIPGVTTKEVGIGRATVEFDPTDLSEDQVQAVVRDAGYESRFSAD